MSDRELLALMAAIVGAGNYANPATKPINVPDAVQRACELLGEVERVVAYVDAQSQPERCPECKRESVGQKFHMAWCSHWDQEHREGKP